MYRNNFIFTCSNFGNKSEIGIYKKKKSREVIPCEEIGIANPRSRIIARQILSHLVSRRWTAKITSNAKITSAPIPINQAEEEEVQEESAEEQPSQAELKVRECLAEYGNKCTRKVLKP